MPLITTDAFRVLYAKAFASSISNSNNIYATLGKVTPWSDEVNPPYPKDNVVESVYEAYRDLQGGKKITASSVIHCIPRYDWVANTVWVQYDPIDDNLRRKPFYVMNSAFGVFKCISNNAEAQSTVEPTGTSPEVIQTSDGYMWKYMFTVSAADQLTTLTPQFIPVRDTANPASNNSLGLQPPPAGGHGADIFDELGAYYLLMTNRFEYSENGKISVNNDYRKICLLANPQAPDGSPFTGNVFSQTLLFTSTDATGIFQPDEVINSSSGGVGTVIEHNTTDSTVEITVASGEFTQGSTVSGATSSVSGTISTVVRTPELKPNSGDFLLMEYRRPILRESDQIENILFVVEF